MTRVNAGVAPRELPDKLLLAEHREITRIPNMVSSGRANMRDIPETFDLGFGHVKFFYNKLGYLRRRYIELYEECVSRGFNVTNKLSAFDGVELGEWEPDDYARQIIVDRISSKGYELLCES